MELVALGIKPFIRFVFHTVMDLTNTRQSTIGQPTGTNPCHLENHASFLLEREVEGINCNHCMKLMSILGEIGICYTRKRTLDFLDALYFNIGEVCINIVFLQLGHL